MTMEPAAASRGLPDPGPKTGLPPYFQPLTKTRPARPAVAAGCRLLVGSPGQLAGLRIGVQRALDGRPKGKGKAKGDDNKGSE